MKYKLLIGILLAVGIGFYGGHAYFKGVYSQPRRNLFLAEVGIPEGALVYLAYNKTFFVSQGYNITLVPFTSGRDALEALLSGRADLATVANTPIVRNALKGKKFKVLATIGNSKALGVVAHRSEVDKASSLIGKKIGVSLDTNGEFFLELFLARNNVPLSKVIKVNLDPDEMLGALIQKKVQAVATWNPYIAEIQQALGDDVTYFAGSEFFTFTWNLVASEEFVSDKHRASAVIRGLDIAREYLEASPVESKQIVSNSLRMDHKLLDKIWGDIKFDTTLDQSLIIALEAHTQWLKARPEFKDTPMPNFLEYLAPEALLSVSPQKVGIIR